MAAVKVWYPDGTEFIRALDGEVLTFGKASGNDIILDGHGVSRHHGRIYRGRDGQWSIEDLGSSNGTIVRGQRIQNRVLQDGDVIIVGRVHLIFTTSEPESRAIRTSGITITDRPEVFGSTMERPAGALAVRDSARLLTLCEFAKRLMGRHDVPGLIDEASSALVSALQAERVVFGLTRDPERESDRLVIRPSHLAGTEMTISRSVLRRAVEGQQAVLVGEANTGVGEARPESMVASGVRSAMCVPMLRGREVSGFIYMDSRHQGRGYLESDLEFACAIGAMVATAIENARLLEAEMVKQRLATELAGARRVQQAILPSEWPEVAGWDVYGGHITCREVGGDYYDALLTEDGRLWLLMADVAGKGAPAAMLASRMHAATQGLLEHCDSPARLLTQLNALLLRRAPELLFVTCLVVLVRPETGDALIASAGHPYPVYVGAGGEACLVAVNSSSPLGIDCEMTYENTPWRFPAASGTLLLYTDGVTEAFRADREQFGEERLLAAMSSSATRAANDVIQAVQQAVEAFRADQPQGDDLSLLACRRIAVA